MDERAFLKLEFQVDDLKERVVKIEAELKEMFGLIKELTGQFGVGRQISGLEAHIERFRQENVEQERELGQLFEAIKHLKSALASSNDKSLAAAAQAITINVEGGAGGDGGKGFGGGLTGDIVQGNQHKS